MLKEDSVFLKQYENRLSLMRDSTDCIFMRYPMSYGDVIESPYCFTGVYGRHNSLIVDGTIRTEADGYGTLVVPGDTLYNVLRVRRKIDADVFVGKLQEADRDTPATSSQFHYCRDFYQWYSDGTSIEINYKVVSGDVDVEATLFDVEGRIYGHIEPHVSSEGTVYERLECGKLRYGRYILNVKAGEKVVTRLISVD